MFSAYKTRSLACNDMSLLTWKNAFFCGIFKFISNIHIFLKKSVSEKYPFGYNQISFIRFHIIEFESRFIV